ncbi:MAG: hypothetical protein AAF961_15040, partial [Planctomycetota bacterium]
MSNATFSTPRLSSLFFDNRRLLALGISLIVVAGLSSFYILPRLEDPVLLRFALWCALDLAAPAALPLQLHVGFGDRDIFMQR